MNSTQTPVSLRGAGRWQMLRYVFYRARFSLLKGVWFWLTRPGSVRLPFFMDVGARVWYPEKFRTGRRVFLGRMVHINANCTEEVCFGERVTLGDFGWVQGTAHLNNPGQSLVIEDNVYIGPFAVIGFHGPVRIGAGTSVGAGFRLSAQEHDLAAGDEIAQTADKGRGIEIGKRCWIGNDVKILDGVKLGDGCVVGAGAVVTKSMPRRSVVAGVPARVIRSLPG
jgi:acetyltransferase-like isoleucine patch superfamily enzyme